MLLIVFGAVFRPQVASFILYVFIGNLLVYTAYYTIMKIFHGERITPITMMCVVFIMLTTLPALYLFSSKQGSLSKYSLYFDMKHTVMVEEGSVQMLMITHCNSQKSIQSTHG